MSEMTAIEQQELWTKQDAALVIEAERRAARTSQATLAAEAAWKTYGDEIDAIYFDGREGPITDAELDHLAALRAEAIHLDKIARGM